MNKCKITLLLLGIVISFSALSACNNTQKERVSVEDSANLLSSAQEEELNKYLLEYENKSTVQLGLKTVESLNGDSIEDYSLKVFNLYSE